MISEGSILLPLLVLVAGCSCAPMTLLDVNGTLGFDSHINGTIGGHLKANRDGLSINGTGDAIIGASWTPTLIVKGHARLGDKVIAGDASIKTVFENSWQPSFTGELGRNSKGEWVGGFQPYSQLHNKFLVSPVAVVKTGDDAKILAGMADAPGNEKKNDVNPQGPMNGGIYPYGYALYPHGYNMAYGNAPNAYYQPMQMPYANTPYANTPYANTPYANTPYANTLYANTPYANTPYANTPYANTPYANTPFANTPYANTTYANTPYANTPYANTPYASTPYANTPYANTPYANTPYANTPYANTPYANTPYANTPYANTPYANTPYANTPYANTTYANTPYANTPYANTLCQHTLCQHTLWLPTILFQYGVSALCQHGPRR